MSKQAVNYLLGQREQARYLQRVDDPEDRRSKRVRLTGRGDAASERMRAAAREVEQEFVNTYRAEELEPSVSSARLDHCCLVAATPAVNPRLLIGQSWGGLDRRRERAMAACPGAEGLDRPARPDGGEVPRAATGRSPWLRALSMSTRNGTSGSRLRGKSSETGGRSQMGNCAGIDWASEKHDVLIEDPAGEQLLARRFRMMRMGSAACARRWRVLTSSW